MTATFAVGQQFLGNVPQPVYNNIPGSPSAVFTYTNDYARWTFTNLPRGNGRI